VKTASYDQIKTARRAGYSEISSVIPISDGRAWVLDRGASSAYLVSSDLLSHDVSLSIPSPEFGGASIYNDLYVYDSYSERIIKYTNGSPVNSVYLAAPSSSSSSSSGSSNSGSSTPQRFYVTSLDVRAADGYVAVSLLDGSVKVFNGVLEEQYSWSYGSFASSVIFKRGYGRNTLYVVDDLAGKMYEMTIWGSLVSEHFIGSGSFLGSASALADNNASVYSEVPVEASFDISDGTITDVEMVHYKVDSIPIDLTGGGDNEDNYRKDGMDRTSIPMDMRKDIVKGARLAE